MTSNNPTRPPPLAGYAAINLQLSYLVNNFTMQVAELLKLPSNPTERSATIDTLAQRLTSHSPFTTVAPDYTNNTTCPAVFRAMVTLSTRATNLLHAPANPEQTETRNTNEITTENTPPYLRAVTAPPRRVARLPPLPLTSNAQSNNAQPSFALTHDAFVKAAKKADRIFGQEAHAAIQLTLSAPPPRPPTFPSSNARSRTTGTDCYRPNFHPHNFLRRGPAQTHRHHQCPLQTIL